MHKTMLIPSDYSKGLMAVKVTIIKYMRNGNTVSPTKWKTLLQQVIANALFLHMHRYHSYNRYMLYIGN